MNVVVAIALSIGILYAWAGVCFLLYRFARTETDDRMRRFLESHHDYFTQRVIGEARRDAATRQAIREAQTRGWCMVGLPVITLAFGVDYCSLLISSAALFFGGLMFALSWYGLHCLTMLGLPFYAKPSGQPDSKPAFDTGRLVRVFSWLGVLLSVVALIFLGRSLVQHLVK